MRAARSIFYGPLGQLTEEYVHTSDQIISIWARCLQACTHKHVLQGGRMSALESFRVLSSGKASCGPSILGEREGSRKSTPLFTHTFVFGQDVRSFCVTPQWNVSISRIELEEVLGITRWLVGCLLTLLAAANHSPNYSPADDYDNAPTPAAFDSFALTLSTLAETLSDVFVVFVLLQHSTNASTCQAKAVSIVFVTLVVYWLLFIEIWLLVALNWFDYFELPVNVSH